MWCFFALLSWRKGIVWRTLDDEEWIRLNFSFTPCEQCQDPTLVLSSQQRLHKLCFLQKLGCQKTGCEKLCWDQARLSSLVNKQVGVQADPWVQAPRFEPRPGWSLGLDSNLRGLDSRIRLDSRISLTLLWWQKSSWSGNLTCFCYQTGQSEFAGGETNP